MPYSYKLAINPYRQISETCPTYTTCQLISTVKINYYALLFIMPYRFNLLINLYRQIRQLCPTVKFTKYDLRTHLAN